MKSCEFLATRMKLYTEYKDKATDESTHIEHIQKGRELFRRALVPVADNPEARVRRDL